MSAADLLYELALLKMGWTRHEGPDGIAFFPETIEARDTAKVADWEHRCLAMHEGQYAITVEPKPMPAGLPKPVRTARGD